MDLTACDDALTLVVPEALAEKVRLFFEKNISPHWWDVWEMFCDDGLEHPQHGRWFYREDNIRCGQYIFRFSLGGINLVLCGKEPSHDGLHCYGDLFWNDFDADKANHRYWRHMSEWYSEAAGK